MEKTEVAQLQAYLKKLFNSDGVEVRGRPTKKDSVEVFINDEFIGVVYVDDDDGERSYDLNIAILGVDLDS